MATSGSVSKSVTSYDTLRFSWWFNSGDQNITNNTTLVRWKLELIASAYGYISSSGTKPWMVNVNGTPYSGSANVGISNNTTKTLASGTTTVAHNSDGSKSFNFSFSQSFSGITFSGVALGVVSGSGSGVLTTIPRASSLTAVDGTLGTAQTLTINRAVNSFTHTITYTCGRYSGTVATKITGTSISFTPAIEWATGAPNGDKVYVSLKIDTYNGNTLIGSNASAIWCYIPASVKPSINGITITEGASIVPSGFPYVQGRSQLKVQVEAAGSQGSTVLKCEIKIDGVLYTGTNITSNVIAKSGAIAIEVTITDSRNRTDYESTSVNVEAYTEPRIENANVYRSDASGARNEEGEYMLAGGVLSVTSLGGANDCSFSVKYKKTSEENYTTIPIGETMTGSYRAVLARTIEADTGSSYDVIIVAADSFVEVSKTFILSTAYTIFNISADGEGFSFGKVSELDGLEIKRPLYLYDTFNRFNSNTSAWEEVTGFIVGIGNNSSYQYKKYSDGSMEISGGMDISAVACNTALGGWYRTAVMTMPNYIESFYTVPDVVMSFATSAGTGAMVWETNGGSTTTPPTFYLIRPTSSASVSGRISVIAKGWWR